MEVEEAINKNKRELFSVYTTRGKHKIERIELGLNIPEFFTLMMLLQSIERYVGINDLSCASGNLLCDTTLELFLGFKVVPMKHLRRVIMENIILIKENSIPPPGCPDQILAASTNSRVTSELYMIQIEDLDREKVQYKLNMSMYYCFQRYLEPNINAFSFNEVYSLLKEYFRHNQREEIFWEGERVHILLDTHLYDFTQIKTLRESQLNGFILIELVEKLSPMELFHLSQIDRVERDRRMQRDLPGLLHYLTL